MEASIPSRACVSGALAPILALGLLLSAPSHAEVTVVTSLSEFTASCAEDDFAVVDFENLLGEPEGIEPDDGNLAIGLPETLYNFGRIESQEVLGSGLVMGGPEPNVVLAVFDLSDDRSVTYALGDNVGINDPSALPSGMAFAASSAGRTPVCFFLPPTDTACNSVGMYISSYDGIEVTFKVFDEFGFAIGVNEVPTDSTVFWKNPTPEAEGFIGLVAPPDRAIHRIEISREEVFAMDDFMFPAWNNDPSWNSDPEDPEAPHFPNPEMCPEPSAPLLGFTALIACAMLSSRQRRHPNAIRAGTHS